MTEPHWWEAWTGVLSEWPVLCCDLCGARVMGTTPEALEEIQREHRERCRPMPVLEVSTR